MVHKTTTVLEAVGETRHALTFLSARELSLKYGHLEVKITHYFRLLIEILIGKLCSVRYVYKKTIALCCSQHTCWEYIQNINFLQILVRPK